MPTLVVSVAVLLAVLSCPPQEDNPQVKQKIQSVENGLVALNLPSLTEMFKRDRNLTLEKKTLSERMQFYNVPGVCVAVINNYQIEWVKAYGVVKVGSDRLVNRETLFEAASTTKLLASVIVLRLIEEGRLDPDKDVNEYLKSWKIEENKFTEERKVTLRLLLTHRSGLNRPDGGFDLEEGSVPSLVQVLKGEAPARNHAAIVEYVPGTKHQYSNFGFLVVQLLLEDVLGKPFAQIAEESVFVPLGMERSTLVHPLKGEFRENLIAPHNMEGKPHERGQHPTALAQGGLITTPKDLALLAIELMKAYQGQSDRLLTQKAARQMFRIELGLDYKQFFGFTGQGLGVFLAGEGEYLYVAYPGHNDPGANCMFIGSPATGKSAVIMTNGAAGLQLSLEILAALVTEYDWPVVQYK